MRTLTKLRNGAAVAFAAGALALAAQAGPDEDSLVIILPKKDQVRNHSGVS